MEDAFTQSLGLLMTLSVPPCVLLATLAAPLIRIVYGDRWISAAPALSLLALFGLTRVSYVIFGSVVTAADRRKTLMVIQGMWLVALVPVLLAGARLDGITGVSAGQLAVAAGLVGPAFVGHHTGEHQRVGHSEGLPSAANRRRVAGRSITVDRSFRRGRRGRARRGDRRFVCRVPVDCVPNPRLARRSPSLDPEVESTEPGAISRQSQLEGLKALLDVATLQAANMSWTEPGVVRESQEPDVILRESQLELKALLDLATLQAAAGLLDRHAHVLFIEGTGGEEPIRDSITYSHVRNLR